MDTAGTVLNNVNELQQALLHLKLLLLTESNFQSVIINLSLVYD